MKTFPTLLLAFLCGFIMMVLISLIYYFIGKMTESGTIDINSAIGKECEVYIPIPEHKSGIGKVSITLNSSLREYEAITHHETLKSGELVKVVGVINDKLVVEKINR